MSATSLAHGQYTQVNNGGDNGESGLKYEPYSKQYGNDFVPLPVRRRGFSTLKKLCIFMGLTLLLFLFYGAGLLTMFFLKKSIPQKISNDNIQPLDIDKHKLHSFDNNKISNSSSSSGSSSSSSNQTPSQPKIVVAPIRGTSQNNKFIGASKNGANLVGINYNKALLTPSTQPELPLRVDGCTFEHTSHLGHDGSAPIGIWRRSEARPIEREDVAQGNLGDCGFGAALLALIGNGQHLDIKNVLSLSSTDSSLIAWFRFPVTSSLINGQPPIHYTHTRGVRIDDKLARKPLVGAAATCPSYIGFNPTLSPPTNLFVPLLEKAWAKYVDAFPDNRFFYKDEKGYKGLTATPASRVLQAITGKSAQVHTRTKPDLDAALAVRILRCVLNRLPCVVVTGSADLHELGTADKYGVLHNDAGDMGGSGKTFTVVERVSPRGVLTFLATHAYAIDNETTGTVDTSDSTKVWNHMVVLRNPWNCNPHVHSKEACTDGKDGELRVKMSTLFHAMVQVEWAENI